MNSIAIIPAKSFSKRFPYKNTADFCGRPLYWWSVEAALDAGITPVVYTDNTEIMRQCVAANVKVARRDAQDGEEMEDCVESVLKQEDVDRFVILQPTSPMRVPGLINEGWLSLEKANKESGYTFEKIKPIGHFGNEFSRVGRTENAKTFLKWHDGNIVWCTKKFFQENGTLLTTDSMPIENVYPATLQVDYKRELDALIAIARKKKFRVFLPGTVKNVAVVSNKPVFDKNYSEFIDSCDAVVRINRMENVTSGTAGSHTDVVLIANSSVYFSYGPAGWNVEQLQDAPVVWLLHDTSDKKELNDKWMQTTSANGGVFLFSHGAEPSRFDTTWARGIKQAFQNWSRAHVYAVGTLDIRLRTEKGWCYHKHSNEQVWMGKAIDAGKLTIVDEESIPPEESYKLKYST